MIIKNNQNTKLYSSSIAHNLLQKCVMWLITGWHYIEILRILTAGHLINELQLAFHTFEWQWHLNFNSILPLFRHPIEVLLLKFNCNLKASAAHPSLSLLDWDLLRSSATSAKWRMHELQRSPNLVFLWRFGES